jgi:RNA polymerase sigma-70 factor, ECF subfamily
MGASGSRRWRLDPNMEISSSTPCAGDDVDLLVRLRAGEDSAFTELVQAFGPRLLAVMQRYLPQEQDRQDALQETFVSAFKALPRFRGESSLGTWLHRIAVNCALMRVRSRKGTRERAIEDFLPKFLADGHRDHPGDAWAITHDTAVLDNETRAIVRQAIDALPESYRLILLVRDIEERTTEETAELLNLSVPNVKTRLHRARQALRELLDRHFG